MLDKIKQLMEIKKQAEQLKRELESTYIEVNEIPGIKISMSAAQKFRSLDIDTNYLQPNNKERLQADLLRSLNAAMQKSQDTATAKMKDISGLNLPGF